MSVWNDRILPHLAHRTLSAPAITRWRVLACAGLEGRVLEIGFGSGLNTELYPAEVSAVDAVEPSDQAWRISRRRRAEARVPVQRTGLDGQRLTASDGQYDAVLSTFTLCTIPDVESALLEVRRVLRPGGTFHFLEHGRAPDVGVERWQRRLDPLQRRVAGGCHLSRDIPALVTGAGLELVEIEAAYLTEVPSVSRPWTHGFMGVASRTA